MCVHVCVCECVYSGVTGLTCDEAIPELMWCMITHLSHLIAASVQILTDWLYDAASANANSSRKE